MELLMTESQKISNRCKIQPLTYWPKQQQKDVFHQVEQLTKTTLKLKTPGALDCPISLRIPDGKARIGQK